MLKSGLSVAHFRRYVPIIEKETYDYFERWGESGQRGEYTVIRTIRQLHLVATCPE